MPALGRVVDHDERSRLYQARLATTQRSVLWGHHAPVLDQGELGSCTGNAFEMLLSHKGDATAPVPKIAA